MTKITVINPQSGDKKTITRATLGVWRRKGWVLEGAKSKKTDLNNLRESKKEDAPSVHDNKEA